MTLTLSGRAAVALAALLLALGGAPPAPVLGAERLLYAVRDVSLERGSDAVRTRIFAVEAVGGAVRLVYSDEDAPITLLPSRGTGDYPGRVLVPGPGAVYGHAVEKRLRPGRWYARPAPVYRLAIDGSNRATRILEPEGTQMLAELFLDPGGARLGYVNHLPSGERTHVFTHAIATGALLSRVDLEVLCGGCQVARIAWLRDGRRLLMSLITVGDDPDALRKEGLYMVGDDGAAPGKLGLPGSPLAWRRDLRPSGGPPLLVGELPDGDLVVRHWAHRVTGRTAQTASFLQRVPRGGSVGPALALGRTDGLDRFELSPSGRYLAFIEAPQGAAEARVWVNDLESGGERPVLTFPLVPYRGSYLGLVGWTRE